MICYRQGKIAISCSLQLKIFSIMPTTFKAMGVHAGEDDEKSYIR